MSRPSLSGAALLAACALSACATTPAAPAAPAAVVEPPAPPPPLSLVGLVAAEQALLKATLALDVKLGPGQSASEIAWTARTRDLEIGAGTAALEPGENGTLRATLPVKYGEALADLAPFQTNGETMDVVVEATAKLAAGEIKDTRSVRMRVPHVPEIYMMSVQASRQSGGAALDLTYLLAAKNPNLFDLRVNSVTYTALLGDKAVASGEQPLGDRIPPSAENNWEFPAVAGVENMGRDFPARLRANDLNWAFHGTMRVGGIDVPIDLKGPLNLSQ